MMEMDEVHPIRFDASVDEAAGEAAERGLPAEVLAILGALQAEAGQGGNASLSLARLSKRTRLRMSTLRRFLSALEEAGVIAVVINEDGTGSVQLLLPPQT